MSEKLSRTSTEQLNFTHTTTASEQVSSLAFQGSIDTYNNHPVEQVLPYPPHPLSPTSESRELQLVNTGHNGRTPYADIRPPIQEEDELATVNSPGVLERLRSDEKGVIGIDSLGILFTGLRKRIVKVRLNRAEKLTNSPEVYEEVAVAAFKGRLVKPELSPVTHRQERQALRVARRRNRNINWAYEQERITTLYGDDIKKRSVTKEKTETGRYTKPDARAERKASRQYSRLERYGDLGGILIKNSIAGIDIPGRAARESAPNNLKQANQLRHKLKGLEQLEQQKRQKRERRRKKTS